MKKIALSLIVIGATFGLTAASFAQDAGPRRGAARQGKAGRGQGQMGKMREVMQKVLGQLNLTDEQKSKLKDVEEKGKEKMKALMEKAKDGDREKMRDEFREMQKSHREAVQEILTKEQQEKFKSLMKEEIAKMRKEREKNGDGTPPPAL